LPEKNAVCITAHYKLEADKFNPDKLPGIIIYEKPNWYWENFLL
jgi:hypothetical protein